MSLSALCDGRGWPVDWWFIYKLPCGTGPHKNSTGDEYLYCDSSWGSKLNLSSLQLHKGRNALADTLKQVFSGDPDTGYILWNDEIPPTKAHPKPENNSSKGHTKGVLAFNKKTNSGLYLLHSTPRFPAEGEIELPEFEREYGQTFLCVTLNYATVLQIAEIVRVHHEPQVYAAKNLPAEHGSPLYKLARENHEPLHPKHPGYIDFTFRSKDWNVFRMFAKHKKWSEPTPDAKHGRDFWNHLVGPALCDDINVETWRRGIVFENVDSGSRHITFDALGMDLEAIGYKDYSWSFTKDHAKWGGTKHRPPGLLFQHPGFVVIADINRDASQAKRSGGGLAFQHDGIWTALKSAVKVDSTVQKKPHAHGPAQPRRWWWW
jgi:deoxyribonuclease II